jgi:hypothetical protein
MCLFHAFMDVVPVLWMHLQEPSPELQIVVVPRRTNCHPSWTSQPRASLEGSLSETQLVRMGSAVLLEQDRLHFDREWSFLWLYSGLEMALGNLARQFADRPGPGGLFQVSQ